MVSIQAGEQEVLDTLEDGEGRVSLAAVNGPASSVISGDEDAVLAVEDLWRARGHKTKRLQVSHAFHSPRMDAMLDEFAEVAGGLSFSPPRIPIVSNVSGVLVPAEEICSAEYWVRHVREPVRFSDGMRWLQDQGVSSFLELGPDGVLSALAQECLDEGVTGEGLDDGGDREPAVAVPLLRGGDRPEVQTLIGSLAEVWAHGVDVDWRALFAGSDARRVRLPTYAFQRERYWMRSASGSGDAASIGQASADHPLLGASVALAGERGWLFTGRLSLESHPWLSDHAVMGIVLMPATAFLELALHAGSRAGLPVLSELILEAPLVLPEKGAVQLQVSVDELDESGNRSLSIYSRSQNTSSDDDALPEEQWIQHAHGVLTGDEGALNGHVGTLEERARALAGAAPWPPEGCEAMSVDDLYDRLAEQGFEYGPVFRGLRAIWRRDDEIFAEISLSGDQQDDASSFGMHPSLLDGALHATELSFKDTSTQQNSIRLPFSFNTIELYTKGATSLRVCLTPTTDNALSLIATDGNGQPIVSIDSLVIREISQTQLGTTRNPHHDSLFRMDWKRLPVPPESIVSEVVILGEENSALAMGLSKNERSVGVYSDLTSLVKTLEQGSAIPLTVLVDCCATRDARQSTQQRSARKTPADGDDADSGLLESARIGTERVLGLLQAWLLDERFSDSRLVLVTDGAMAMGAGEGVPGLAQSPVWGLVRSAQSEYPERFVLVDVDGDEASFGALDGALALGESQLALREGTVFVPRLARAHSDAGVLGIPEDVAEWRMSASAEGTLEGLSPVASPEAGGPLEPGQVRVGVRAGGLNFRDVLIALGMYPGEAVIGGEGAGVVLEVGPGMEGLAAGDRVMGLFSGMGPILVSDHRLLARIPDGWSFARAASMPIVFLTAYYGLVDLAALKSGERVLVHAGTGGVGMAAVQLARHLGAEVFATASPAKWQTLRSMGLDEAHIASSRTLDFKGRFLGETDGHGVDVVLNSLAGEFVDASLDLLGEGGRFVEMGKTDIRDPNEVAEAHPGALYQAFDVIEAGPERIREMLDSLLGFFESGVLEPLPVSAWDIRHAPRAFRFMSQARHTGKVVLSLPSRPIDPRGTVLITGGTGDLGALMARHLASEHGASHLLLASRRGPEAAGAPALQTELESLGAEVTIAACDVSRRDALETLLNSIPEEHPLNGVVHTAGVLDDGVIGSLTPDRLDRVLAPKLDAAWHLHTLTRHMDLSTFVLFSSAAGVLGGPGQGNYAAANAFLDALAAHRRALGLPGISLAWGLWEQTSGIGGGLSEADLSRMTRSGVGALPSEEGLALFDAALDAEEALMLPAPLDFRALRAKARAERIPALFSDLVRGVSTHRSDEQEASLAQRLATAPEAERESVVLDLVRAQVAIVLGHTSLETIDVKRTFKELGFDSLTAVELRNRLGGATGLRLPITLVFDYPTTSAVAWYLLGEVDQKMTTPAADAEFDRLERVLPSLASDDKERSRITARLQALLSQLGQSRPGNDGVTVAQEIESASDDELFRYLDEKSYTSREIS